MYDHRSFYQSLCQLTLWVRTQLFARLVGADEYGNAYYASRRRDWAGREARWVIYAGEPEASKVPPSWFGWLHHMHDDPLPNTLASGYLWYRPYRPNLTGTMAAYLPAGHLLSRMGQRTTATPHTDFRVWQPTD